MRAPGSTARPPPCGAGSGVTVMIGQNDLAHEVFTVADARSLAGFVELHHVAQISIWSLNRDSECGSVFGEVGVVSNVCSGVSQTPLEFTHIFSSLPGTVTADTRAPAADPADHIDGGRQSGDEPLSGLAVRRRLPGRLQGRLASRDLPGDVVRPGPGAGHPGWRAPARVRGCCSARCWQASPR